MTSFGPAPINCGKEGSRHVQGLQPEPELKMETEVNTAMTLL